MTTILNLIIYINYLNNILIRKYIIIFYIKDIYIIFKIFLMMNGVCNKLKKKN
jgi:hypothetical protein